MPGNPPETRGKYSNPHSLLRIHGKRTTEFKKNEFYEFNKHLSIIRNSFTEGMVKIKYPAHVKALMPVKSLSRPAKIPPNIPPISNRIDRLAAS